MRRDEDTITDVHELNGVVLSHHSMNAFYITRPSLHRTPANLAIYLSLSVSLVYTEDIEARRALNAM